MSEEQADYLADALEMMGAGYEQTAAVIDPPRTLKALRDNGMVEFHAWGWVKMSARFMGHIRKLKGSKLSTWQAIALSINENGECDLSAPEISALTGYSVSETREAIAELDEMGYLAVTRKSGRRSIYRPAFAARSTNNPSDEPISDPSRKTTPPVSTGKYADDPSSSARENSVPTFKRVKRVNTVVFSENQTTANGNTLADINSYPYSEYPDDVREWAYEFCKLYHFSAPERPQKNSPKTRFSFWVNALSELSKAAGEFGIEALRAQRKDFEAHMATHGGLAPFTISSPQSVVNTVAGKAANMRDTKFRPTAPPVTYDANGIPESY